MNALGMRLTGFELPQGADVRNALAPFSQGLDTYRAGMQQQFEGDRAMAREKLAQDQFGLAQQANQRAGKSHDFEMQKAKVQQIAGLAQMADQEKDPVRRSAIMTSIYQRHPDLVPHLSKNGFDPADHVNVPKMLIAEARGFVDPQAEALKKAQIDNLNRREEPEIVRQLRAAGVDPRSEQGRAMILNSIKGGDPISQAVGAAIKDQFQPAAPSQSPIRPQSFNAPEGTPPGIILTGAGDPPSAAAPPALVDTPIGKMPADKARLLGFGIAYGGKGEAGKMFSEAANAGGLGKEGMNKLDETLVTRAQDLGELENIRTSFDPKYLGLEGQLKGAGVGWADYLTSGNINPKNKEFIDGYTKFATATLERLNNRIKAMAGATVTGQEADRMNKANPTLSDGPTVFQSKLNAQIEMHKLAIARTNWIKREFKGTDQQIAEMAKTGRIEGFTSLDGMKDIFRQRGLEIEKQLRQANPGADKTLLEREATKLAKQEFGI